MARAERVLDIHSYERKTQQAREQLRRSSISDRNKALIFGYYDACLIKNVCGTVRLIRVLGTLRLFAQLLRQDFDTLDRAGIERLVGLLLSRQPAYSAETLGTYKAILKTFMTWVLVPDQFPTKNPPSAVAWLTGSVKAKDKHRLQRNELLTPNDLAALLQVCRNPRDRALLSVLWETGGRISEIGNLQLEHLAKQTHGFLIDLYGKTGHRNVLVISSAPYLAQWLASHPFAKDRASPLWVHYQFTTAPLHLKYDTIRTLLRRYFARARITKKYNPHLFRHSRATHLVANGLMTEAQAKVFFGWSPSSKMLATYAHLTTQDANNAILAEHHLAPIRPNTDGLRTTVCPTCNELNTPETSHCTRCTNPLRVQTAYNATRETDARLLKIIEVLVRHGLMDDAADQIREAGLGPTLKTLAENAKRHATWLRE